jgi:hypothetical protein
MWERLTGLALIGAYLVYVAWLAVSRDRARYPRHGRWDR